MCHCQYCRRMCRPCSYSILWHCCDCRNCWNHNWCCRRLGNGCMSGWLMTWWCCHHLNNNQNHTRIVLSGCLCTSGSLLVSVFDIVWLRCVRMNCMLSNWCNPRYIRPRHKHPNHHHNKNSVHHHMSPDSTLCCLAKYANMVPLLPRPNYIGIMPTHPM